MFKGRVFVLCVLCCAIGIQAQQSPPSSAEDLVRIGLAQNQELAALREGIAEAKGNQLQAGVRPSPTLTGRGATGRPLGTVGEETFGGDVSQEIETFGKRSRRIAVARFDVGKAESELLEKSADLAFEIRNADADRQAEISKQTTLRDLKASLLEALRLMEARVREGDAPALDANLLRVEVAKATVQLSASNGRLASAEAALRRLLNVDRSAVLPFPSVQAMRTATVEDWTADALTERADLKTARLNERQAIAGVPLARANARPNVTVGAGYTQQNSFFDDLQGVTPAGTLAPIRDHDNILTFNVSIPLRLSGSSRGAIDAATARRNAAELRRKFLEQSIPNEVEAAFQKLQNAQSAKELLDTVVLPASANNLQVIAEAYKLGQLRQLDVITEQRQVLDNRLASIDAQAEVQHAWAELQRAVGGNLP